MGVEGKERQRELEAGAQVLSGQLGKTIQRLRKAYNLSLSELAEQSGVAKSIISQIERNETNPTLATIWRLSQALDVSIERVLAASDEEPFIEKSSAADTPILVSDDGKMRLAIIGWIKTVEWLQWYDVQLRARAACSNRTATSAARSSASRCLDGEFEVEVRRDRAAREGRRDAALPLRPAAYVRCVGRRAGPRDHGVHPQGGGDGLGRYCGAFRPLAAAATRCTRPLPSRSASGSWDVLRTTAAIVEPTEVAVGVMPEARDVRDVALASSPPRPVSCGVMFGTQPAALRVRPAGKAPLRRRWRRARCARCGIRRNGPAPRRDRRRGSSSRSSAGPAANTLAVEEGELPQAEAAPDVEGERQVVVAHPALHRRQGLHEGEEVAQIARRHALVGGVGEGRDSSAARPARRRRAWRARTAPRSRRRCRPADAARCSARGRCRRATAAGSRRRAGCGRSWSGVAWQDVQPPAKNIVRPFARSGSPAGTGSSPARCSPGHGEEPEAPCPKHRQRSDKDDDAPHALPQNEKAGARPADIAI